VARYAHLERRALADELVRVGPDAPTLCEGWTAADLAAHLVLRERRPDAALGIVASPLAGHTATVQRSLREKKTWPELVDLVRNGPPFPLRFKVIDEPMNAGEFFVHVEDLRRAAPGWEPRDLDAEFEKALWRRIRFAARLARRGAPGPLCLDAPGYGRVTVKGGEPNVVVTGPPSELSLYLFGRAPEIRVKFAGAPADVEAARTANFGL
jgi:uncharacterized protein (TIGR03085 family)